MGRTIGVLASLPSDLEYLIGPALKFGIFQADDDSRSRFLQRATAAERSELAETAKRYRESAHHELVAEFFDRYPIDKHPEAAKLYWLFGLMGEAGLKISSEAPESVSGYVKSLAKRGSNRLTAERALAARFLPDLGEDAKIAVPALRMALQDEAVEVRIWAHCALARLEGDAGEHEAAIKGYLAGLKKRRRERGIEVLIAGAEAALLRNFMSTRKGRTDRLSGNLQKANDSSVL